MDVHIVRDFPLEDYRQSQYPVGGIGFATLAVSGSLIYPVLFSLATLKDMGTGTTEWA